MKRKLHTYSILLLLIFGLFFGLKAQADYAVSPFDDGMKHVQSKEYRKAIGKFQLSLMNKPTDAASAYNIGKSYLELKKYKQAKEYFEKAHFLQPWDDNTINNLNFTLEKLNEPTPFISPYGWYTEFSTYIGSKNWKVLALSSSILLSLCIFLFFLSGKFLIRKTAILLGILFVILGAFSAFNMYHAESHYEQLKTDSKEIRFQNSNNSVD